MVNSLFPRDKNDYIGMITSLVLISFVTINDLAKMYAQYVNGESTALESLAKFFTGFYLLANVLVNMLRAVKTDTTIHAIDLPRILLPGWRYCSACELNAPPRSFHCFSCNKCVLKRNNHCMFLGKCAGHRNYRFYIMFIVYVWLGTLFSVYINRDFYYDVMFNFQFRKFFIAFIPLFAILFQMIGIVEFFFVFANSICFILLFMLLFYMIVNMRLILNGQTWHENAKNVRAYNLSWFDNLKEVLGNNWSQAALNPFARLSLPSDGTSFKKNALYADETSSNKPLYQQFNAHQSLYTGEATTSVTRRADNVKNI